MRSALGLFVLALGASVACGDGSKAATTGSVGGGSSAGLARSLRGKGNFLIGLGNDQSADDNHDKDGAFVLGPTLDLHYVYLSGLGGTGGWPDWNPNGGYVDMLTAAADRHGVRPMFTLYGMAAWGDGDIAHLSNDSFMTPYWDGVRLLFQRLAAFGKPAVVHVEPDFWGYIAQQSAQSHAAKLAPECAGLPQDTSGVVKCILKLGRSLAPQTAIGFHASEWGGDAASTVALFKALGADGADFVATDMLDRDAGCFEAHTDSKCQRQGTGFYWDESNTTSPNFHEHFAWAKGVHDGVGLPIMWWQIPLGVPSATPGGSTGHYRDNRVHYLFAHVDEMIAAGGFAAAFGVGAENQTTIATDGDQLKKAATAYLANPSALP